MTGISSNPLALAALAGLASYLMMSSGLGLKKLRRRVSYCPVCHRPREACTCRWL
jgi:hypothetical protein